MSKSIKVSEDVYQELHNIQRPRETLSQLVIRLLLAEKLLSTLHPSPGELNPHSGKKTRLQAKTKE